MRVNKIPIELMKEYLSYNPLTGIFRWKQRPSASVKLGAICGRADGCGHLQIRFKYKMYHLHRVAWAFNNGPIPYGLLVDHIDQDPSNNRLKNLRLATKSLNCANSCKRKGIKSSKYKGVSLHRKTSKWRSEIRYKRKLFYLGLFSKEKDAAIEYDKKAIEFFGKFASLNF